jgi:zinc protease
MVERYSLDNGLTVLLKPTHTAPVASFWIWYRVGSRNEVSGITGISHWVEHMLFKGTPAFPKGEIERQVARNGGGFNGLTWLDFTTFLVTLPADRIDLGLQIESDRMVNSLFDDQEVNAERTVIISERQGSENSPRFLLAEEVQAAVFRVHPYHHLTIGNMCDLEAMTREDLWRHYQTYYGPNNAIAVGVGDFDPGWMRDRIEQLFGPVPHRSEIAPLGCIEPPQRGERRVVVEGSGNTAYVQVVFRVPEARHDDFMPLVVLDTILAGANGMNMFMAPPPNRSSRLYKALVDTELAADVSSSLWPMRDPFMYGIEATVRPGRSAAEVEEALGAELLRIAATPVSQWDLERAIKQASAQFAYASESVTHQAFWLGFSEVVADTNWFQTYLDRLSAVGVADVHRVAETYLVEANRTVGHYLPKGNGDGP